MIRRLAAKSFGAPASIRRRHGTSTRRRKPTGSLAETSSGFRAGASASADATSVTVALGMAGAAIYLHHQEGGNLLVDCSASPQENVDLVKIEDINSLYSLGEILGEGMW